MREEEGTGREDRGRRREEGGGWEVEKEERRREEEVWEILGIGKVVGD